MRVDVYMADRCRGVGRVAGPTCDDGEESAGLFSKRCGSEGEGSIGGDEEGAEGDQEG